ncbi:MAG: uridylate kinase [Clostridia bacterium]|nr:uridylate kinase [Clostridia bacterium]
MNFDVELVGKIGSMALVDRAHGEIDYNKFVRISRFLRPGMIWVSSGATVIGRLDYIRRNGHEIVGDADEAKADYASQGQAILMQTYRNFIDSKYSVRQVLLEHNHFNDPVKREHIKNLLVRCAGQNAIPIINYNDCVSAEENRKWEIEKLKSSGNEHVVELVDNDETASQVSCLVKSRLLVILTNLDGIYSDISNPDSLIREISGKDAYEVIQNIDIAKKNCVGASREGANGAGAKLEYIKPCIENGTRVIIASSRYDMEDIIAGKVPCTTICAR